MKLLLHVVLLHRILFHRVLRHAVLGHRTLRHVVLGHRVLFHIVSSEGAPLASPSAEFRLAPFKEGGDAFQTPVL